MSYECQLFVHAASEVRCILEDDAVSVSKESDNYWVLAAALKGYIDKEGKGQLPIEVCMPPELCALRDVYSAVCRAFPRGAWPPVLRTLSAVYRSSQASALQP